MSSYRLYCLDGVGHITSVEVIEADDDGEAIIVAHSAKRAVSYEIWDQKRLIARVPAIQAQA